MTIYTMMKHFLTEWNRFLIEKTPVPPKTPDPNKAARIKKQQEIEAIRQKNVALINSAIAGYKGKMVHGADFGTFLEKIATFESRYDPNAENGSYKGAFQISSDIAAGANPFKPDEAAKALYTFFVTKTPGLFKSNPDLVKLVEKNPMLFLFLVHNQGLYGAVRIMYTVNSLSNKLTKKIDTKIGPDNKGKSTIDNINAQKISALKDKEAELSGKIKDQNVLTATAFVNFLKEKYQLWCKIY